ncbi:MAG: prepilin-type N-terminal cleavage/methylation domain-containing protein [Nitrospira sp.]|nr:prepilin-type N-terminal cleavage/methylation domain-containing protein [Nitrospira sp.]
MKRGGIMGNEKGFTLMEIIAVLVILGILAAIAVPKYMGLQDTARQKAGQGQIAEVKGRLAQSLGSYMLVNNGTQPANGAALVTYTNTLSASSCPTSATTEGDFEFSCAGGAGTTKTVTITVSQVQGTAVTGVSGTYTF